MLYRIVYSCLQAWRYRAILANYAQDQHLQVAKIVDLSPEKLLQQGIKGLILDFDGVLAAYASVEPEAVVITWLRHCGEVFPPNSIFILSNKPTVARQEYFAEHFPQIAFIIASKKKPFPDGILQILHTTKLATEELLIIDDRLGTGILAAAISQIKGFLITKPYTDHNSHPIQELLFTLIRKCELSIFKF